jgi:hypothetical protein
MFKIVLSLPLLVLKPPLNQRLIFSLPSILPVIALMDEKKLLKTSVTSGQSMNKCFKVSLGAGKSFRFRQKVYSGLTRRLKWAIREFSPI